MCNSKKVPTNVKDYNKKNSIIGRTFIVLNFPLHEDLFRVGDKIYNT